MCRWGIANPVDVYRVCSARMTESRYQAQHAGTVLPLIGRDHELAQLTERWHQAKAGEGQMILLTGEAGIGKSRILRALEDSLNGQRHYLVTGQTRRVLEGSRELHHILQQSTGPRASTYSECNGFPGNIYICFAVSAN
jgi:hypothetical protein